MSRVGGSAEAASMATSFEELKDLVWQQTTTIKSLKGDVDKLKRHLEDEGGEVSGGASGGSRKRRKPLAWFQKTMKQLASQPAQKSALKKLRPLVAQVVSEALWIRKREFDDLDEDESDEELSEEERAAAHEERQKKRAERAGWTKLPGPNEIRSDDDGAQSFQVDFTAKHSDPENKDLMAHVVETVSKQLEIWLISVHQEAHITPAHIADCPKITAEVIEYLFRKRFETLKGDYKVQTQEEAAAKHKAKGHKTRVRTLQNYKYETRTKAAPIFKHRYGKCPLKILDPDYMSGDESAGEDEELLKTYYDAARVPETDRTGPGCTLVLGTQQLKWRAAWVTVVYKKLDELHQQCETRGHQHKKRVACGPIITTLPRTVPPECMLDAAWVLQNIHSDPANANGTTDPEGWGPAEAEEKKWAQLGAASAASAASAA
ncbi:hypothetical protein AURDEDRAFT_129013 [Auricularia subglabra TFB-10046 SS5]|nr:hypothetical protein AURDEDRAFT_129013 [Auricularia subglabra TFB-10046 SS5]